MIEVPDKNVARVKLDGKGRVTIPKDIRDRWSLEAGDRPEIAIVGAEQNPYQCDECEERFDLSEVLLIDGSVVCAGCVNFSDRVITDGGDDEAVDEQEPAEVPESDREAANKLIEESIEEVVGSPRVRDREDRLSGNVDEHGIDVELDPGGTVTAIVNGSRYEVGNIEEVDSA